MAEREREKYETYENRKSSKRAKVEKLKGKTEGAIN